MIDDAENCANLPCTGLSRAALEEAACINWSANTPKRKLTAASQATFRMTLSGTEIRKPKDWQAFERAMRVLMSHNLGDPGTQLSGRSGQPQHGVDISGRRISDGKLIGIQCKLRYQNRITGCNLRREVTRALAFRPALNEFILATTAEKDVAIEEVARLITAERQQSSHPLVVSVWGWADIEARVAGYPGAVNAFDPTWNPFAEQARTETRTGIRKVHERLDELTRPSEAWRANPHDAELLSAFRGLVTHDALTFLAHANFRFTILLSGMEPFNEIEENWLGTRYEFVDPDLQAALELVMAALHRFVSLVESRISPVDENPNYGSPVTAEDKAAGRARARRAGARVINQMAHVLWRAVDTLERAARAKGF